ALQGAYHPLMSKPVPNSVNLDNRSALISGSNMTGKTAFMKVVGINIVLAQTLGFCLAESATIRRSAVMTAIRSEQGIESGKSRYLDEIQAILGFVQSAARGECHIFIIDEIFSGTNTDERIAAGKAVLDDLSQHAQVLATTHDIELQDLLSERFERLHFREDPDVDGFFDYRLRAGASTERNAIRLLERVGFPTRIIEEAMWLAKRPPDRPAGRSS
ncbi:MAG: MutS-related protein, partial [Steroidobacteraceae bacterium]